MEWYLNSNTYACTHISSIILFKKDFLCQIGMWDLSSGRIVLKKVKVINQHQIFEDLGKILKALLCKKGEGIALQKTLRRSRWELFNVLAPDCAIMLECHLIRSLRCKVIKLSVYKSLQMTQTHFTGIMTWDILKHFPLSLKFIFIQY